MTFGILDMCLHIKPAKAQIEFYIQILKGKIFNKSTSEAQLEFNVRTQL
jgi:hypothetical protein